MRAPALASGVLAAVVLAAAAVALLVGIAEAAITLYTTALEGASHG